MVGLLLKEWGKAGFLEHVERLLLSLFSMLTKSMNFSGVKINSFILNLIIEIICILRRIV